MAKDSLDIEPVFKREIREYTVSRGSVYTQTRQYNKKGNLEKEIWERDSGKEVTILNDAAYISKEKYKQLKNQKLKPSDLIKLAKKEGYTGLGGLIVLLYQEKLYFSSDVIEIEPPFENELKIEA
jgi:hypothetical protein